MFRKGDKSKTRTIVEAQAADGDCVTEETSRQFEFRVTLKTRFGMKQHRYVILDVETMYIKIVDLRHRPKNGFNVSQINHLDCTRKGLEVKLVFLASLNHRPFTIDFMDHKQYNDFVAITEEMVQRKTTDFDRDVEIDTDFEYSYTILTFNKYRFTAYRSLSIDTTSQKLLLVNPNTSQCTRKIKLSSVVQIQGLDNDIPSKMDLGNFHAPEGRSRAASDTMDRIDRVVLTTKNEQTIELAFVFGLIDRIHFCDVIREICPKIIVLDKPEDLEHHLGDPRDTAMSSSMQKSLGTINEDEKTDLSVRLAALQLVNEDVKMKRVVYLDLVRKTIGCQQISGAKTEIEIRNVLEVRFSDDEKEPTKVSVSFQRTDPELVEPEEDFRPTQKKHVRSHSEASTTFTNPKPKKRTHKRVGSMAPPLTASPKSKPPPPRHQTTKTLRSRISNRFFGASSRRLDRSSRSSTVPGQTTKISDTSTSDDIEDNILSHRQNKQSHKVFAAALKSVETKNCEEDVDSKGGPELEEKLERAPGGVGPAPGGLGPTPGGLGATPGGLGPAPGGLGPTPGGLGPAPGGLGPAPDGELKSSLESSDSEGSDIDSGDSDSDTEQSDDGMDVQFVLFFVTRRCAVAFVEAIDKADPLEPKHRVQILKEIVTSEGVYVEGLEVLHDQFEVKFDRNSIVEEQDLQAIFSNTEQLLEFHQCFFQELCKFVDIPHVFAKFADFFRMYTQYVNSYELCLQTLEKLKNHDKLQNYLKHKRDAGVNLMDYLILPIQRLPRYELLFSQLARNTPHRHSEFGSIQHVHQKLKKITSHVNETKRQIESQTRILEISQKIYGKFSETLLCPGRRFLREGILSQRTKERFLIQTKTEKRQVFLFSDIIFWTTEQFKFVGLFDLHETTLEHFSQQEEFFVGFELSASDPLKNDTPYTFICDSYDEKCDWIRNISTAIQNINFQKKSMEIAKGAISFF